MGETIEIRMKSSGRDSWKSVPKVKPG